MQKSILYLAPVAFEQKYIFSELHLQQQGTTVCIVTSRSQSHLNIFYDTNSETKV